MDLLEKCVVTEAFCARPDTYNIKVGGEGGWDYVNNELHLNGNKMFVKNMTDKERDDILKWNIGPDQIKDLPEIKKFFKANKFKPLI